MKSKIVNKLLAAVLGACVVLGAAACSNHDNPPDFSAGNKGSSADAGNNPGIRTLRNRHRFRGGLMMA